jgi:hypothetical protein
MISLKKAEHSASARNVQFAQVTGRITLADGSDAGEYLFDHYESWGNKFRRLAGKVIPFLAIGLMAGASLKAPDALPYIAPLAPAATVITNAGQAIVTNLVSGLGGTVPRYVAWGTGAGTAAAADTTLFTESSQETRTTGTPTRVTTTVTNDTLQVTGTITVATAGKTITNVGLFDASTTGNLYFKSDFTGLALLVGDSISFTLKIAFT